MTTTKTTRVSPTTDASTLVGRTFTTGIGTFRVDSAGHSTALNALALLVTVVAPRASRTAYCLDYGQVIEVIES
jgi:hypothetical protein